MPVKILLADKSITIQKVVEMLFSGREYEVACVSDGETALNEASRFAPDVVLADVDLPRIDGYSLAARLKKTPALAQTPVILMMSRDDVYEDAKGRQSGIVDYIAKPFESQELIGKVKKALAGAPPRPDAAPTQTAAQRPAAPSPAAKPKQATPANIFDIISEAPTQADVRRMATPPREESVYEVEPVVEEVEAPLVREESKALPIGAKAVEEMRAGLGLPEKRVQASPTPPTFESFDLSDETEKPVTAPVRPAPRPASPPAMPQPAAAPPTLPAAELKKMVEETVAKLAGEAFKNLAPPSLPKISDETIRRGIEEAVMKIAREIARDVIEKVAWEVIPQLAETMIKEEIERLKAEP
jgi:DNA-binding response OmpR family regulator